MYNQEPTYSILRNFGCTCYPYLRPYATSKLDSRSDKCIFLGYSASHLGYRCLSLTSDKLYISRDVIFQEHDYPFESSSSINNSPSSSPLKLLGRFPHSLLPPIWLSLHSPPLTQPFNLLSHQSSRHHLHHRHYLHHRYRLPPRSH